MRQTLRFMLSGLVALTAAGLAGCGGGSLSVNDGHVRLVNATTGIGALDLYQSSSLLSGNVAASTASPYVDLKAASYTFNLNLAGSGATAATLPGTVQKKNDYTIIAYTSGGTLTATYLSDNEGSPSSGTAKLRLFNADTTDVASVDAYLLTTACSGLATSPAAPFFTAATGLQASYTQVNAASGGTTYHLCVTPAGDKSDLRLDIPSLTLSDGQIVTVILTRSTGGVLLNGLVLNQQGSLTAASNASARIRLAVGATGGAIVTATANGVPLGTNLPAPAVGLYMVVPSGPLTLVATIGGAAVPDPGLSTEPGDELTLLVAGTTATKPVLIADDNSASTSAASPVKLRLVNGMGTTLPAVLTDNFINVGSAAPFGTSSGYAQVQASTALALLQASAGTASLCQSASVTLTAGNVYTVFLLGDVPATPTPPACAIIPDR
ncbi:MAG: DUF4397 domain-containing protein [Caldimonas sp.]